jgi:hypothetical protein
MPSYPIAKPTWTYTHHWNNCMIASIANVIMIPHYPHLSHEHGWDGATYLIQDSQGTRGSITFQDHYAVAAFRNENVPSRSLHYSYFFEHAPSAVQHIAQKDTLQYLLEDIDGQVRPSISTACWISQDMLYSNDTWEDLLNHGASLFFKQIMELEQAYTYWAQVNEMNEAQFHLLKSLSERKITRPLEPIVLTSLEIQAIGTPEEPEEDGMDLCEASFQEIGISFPT